MTDEATKEAQGQSPDATGSEATSTTDPLDNVLAQFEAEQKKTEAKNDPVSDAMKGIDPNELKEALQLMRELKQERQTSQFDTALSSAVEVMRNDQPGLDGVPDHVLEGVLWTSAHKDKRVEKAFTQRETNPEVWEKVVRGLADKAAKDFKGIGKRSDRGKSGLRDAITLAGSTETLTDAQRESERIANLPADQFNAEMRKKHGQPIY